MDGEASGLSSLLSFASRLLLSPSVLAVCRDRWHRVLEGTMHQQEWLGEDEEEGEEEEEGSEEESESDECSSSDETSSSGSHSSSSEEEEGSTSTESPSESDEDSEREEDLLMKEKGREKAHLHISIKKEPVETKRGLESLPFSSATSTPSTLSSSSRRAPCDRLSLKEERSSSPLPYNPPHTASEGKREDGPVVVICTESKECDIEGTPLSQDSLYHLDSTGHPVTSSTGVCLSEEEEEAPDLLVVKTKRKSSRERHCEEAEGGVSAPVSPHGNNRKSDSLSGRCKPENRTDCRKDSSVSREASAGERHEDEKSESSPKGKRKGSGSAGTRERGKEKEEEKKERGRREDGAGKEILSAKTKKKKKKRSTKGEEGKEKSYREEVEELRVRYLSYSSVYTSGERNTSLYNPYICICTDTGMKVLSEIKHLPSFLPHQFLHTMRTSR